MIKKRYWTKNRGQMMCLLNEFILKTCYKSIGLGVDIGRCWKSNDWMGWKNPDLTSDIKVNQTDAALLKK